MKLGKFMELQLMRRPRGRKTDTWRVTNAKHGDFLGFVVWSNGWRQYVFEPEGGTVFSHGCLDDLRNFIAGQNAIQKGVKPLGDDA